MHVRPSAQGGRTAEGRPGLPFYPVPHRRWIMVLISHQTRKIIMCNTSTIRIFRIANVQQKQIQDGAVSWLEIKCVSLLPHSCTGAPTGLGTNGETRIHGLILHHPHDRTKSLHLSAMVSVQVMHYSNHFVTVTRYPPICVFSWNAADCHCFWEEWLLNRVGGGVDKDLL